jgi:hypothetical protein
VRTIISSVHISMMKAPLRTCLNTIMTQVCVGVKSRILTGGNIIMTRTSVLPVLASDFKSIFKPSVFDTATNLTWPRETRRKWIELVHSAAYPVWYQQGSDQILTSNHIQNVAKMLETFRSWLERFVEELDPTSDDERAAKTFLSDVLLAAMFARRESDLAIYSTFRSSTKLFALRLDLVAKDTDVSIVDNIIKFYGREVAMPSFWR